MTNKSSIFAVVATVIFAGLLAKLHAALDKRAPLGYEDENGFHYGAQPVTKPGDWRSSF